MFYFIKYNMLMADPIFIDTMMNGGMFITQKNEVIKTLNHINMVFINSNLT